ncbi:lipase family protein [Metabacillus sp. GX 13764]|uniref:lipase family protein n=1 Tax=Metabacillus kandeliae TaxID=2900151 RepID=UPI001E5164E4|nr:lipase family protein [Metabacillus kandeliae]
MNITPSVNKDAAVLLADCSLLTYEQFSQNGQFTVPAGYRHLLSFKARSIYEEEWFGFLIESEETVILAFRGTQSDPDWIADANIGQTPYPYADAGMVHKGFLSIYNTCREEILTFLHSLSPKKKLLITGHSLGAALAALSALDIEENSAFKSPLMYTYGGPRIGCQKFVSAFQQTPIQYLRFANLSDLVPLLPPTKIKNPYTEAVYTYRHLPRLFLFSIQKGSIKENHSMYTYLEAVEGLP